MAERAKRKGKNNLSPPDKKLNSDQKRLLFYAVVVIVVLLLFALEPGFFLGLIIGVLGYKYYLEHMKG